MSGATFREFADQVKHSYLELVRHTHDRDPTPMVIFDTPGGVRMQGVDAAFFENEERRVELVERFVVPAIGEHGATKAAWAFAGAVTCCAEAMRSEGREHNPACLVAGWGPVVREGIVATVIDPEVHEVWFAETARRDDYEAGVWQVGEWEAWTTNEQAGLLLTPIQEALR